MVIWKSITLYRVDVEIMMVAPAMRIAVGSAIICNNNGATVFLKKG
jgi:hypothetical protein